MEENWGGPIDCLVEVVEGFPLTRLPDGGVSVNISLPGSLDVGGDFDCLICYQHTFVVKCDVYVPSLKFETGLVLT